MSDHTPEDRAVMLHLVKLIQSDPDVRYCVGGFGTQMRQLLVAAIKATGFPDDPLTALRPPPHRADEKSRAERLSDEIDQLRAAAREALFGHYEDREAARAKLEALL
jgi:hypothetical protein